MGLCQLLLVGVDAVIANIAFYLAFWIRFDGVIPGAELAGFLDSVLIISFVAVASFYSCGLYSNIWRYAGSNGLVKIAAGVTLAITGLVVIQFFDSSMRFPRSVFVLAWLLLLVGTGIVRFSRTAVREFIRFLNPIAIDESGARRAMIVGAGDAGEIVVRELRKHLDSGLIPVALVDDDPRKHGMKIHDVKVMGGREEIPSLVDKLDIADIIIAIPSAPPAEIRKIVDICEESGAKIHVLPSIHDLVNGRTEISELCDLEIEDVLRREQVSMDLTGVMDYLSGKVVLVTGAGGSIGSEICRQVARFGPRKLILLGHGENSIFEAQLDLKKHFPELDLEPVIVDIQDDMDIDRVFEATQPDLVFHAAAHKHVPLMERNVTAAVKNNIFGTWNVADLAGKHQVPRFVMISTDKAVNPINVMGFTKRIGELIVQSLNERYSTTYAVVRFGNVLASRGSVIPIFKKQIADGGPVTVTHPEMTRYFMTIPEAAQLVIQAGGMARGGEIFVLDMGKPVRIVDLARRLIRLSGYVPDVDIDIQFIGMRPGEKLHEELWTADEARTATSHSQIFVAKGSGCSLKAVTGLLRDLEALIQQRTDEETLLNVMKSFVQKVEKADSRVESLEERRERADRTA